MPLDYMLSQNSESGWKVYDIKIDGVSLVTNYRSTYDRQIRAKGIDGLVESLASSNLQPES